ncbi:unnamed protein product [Rotaria socialis]|uniref:Uncharacterized protein n=4 Tax=Rotaria TaxID=231623 RepID=A0A821CJT4_9BILA|nr:unnamed protein product [Rotaria socialis]CAF4438595.1 unnamed protein product [Rotaria socialis]CAF4608682.1 unnamed protein product [Rotaria socialis]
MNRNIRQRQLNMKLSVLPIFTPLSTYKIYHINQSTPTILLQDLITLARKTTKFTIDTESDYYTNEPALIQIEFIHSQSIVLLIEICHLPHELSVLFWMIRSLMNIIFKPSNVIIQINDIDVQGYFNDWHDNLLENDYDHPLFDNKEMLCSYSRKSLEDRNHKWSLQMAITYVFREFLDKTRTQHDTPTEQKIVDQLHQSPKDINRTIYNTPTKPSVLKENQAEIHSHDVQTNDERPPLVNFLSCYVSLTQYQEDNSINIPAVNTPEDLELELQQSQKDNEILSLYNVDSYLEHKNPTNTMIIIDVP